MGEITGIDNGYSSLTSNPADRQAGDYTIDSTKYSYSGNGSGAEHSYPLPMMMIKQLRLLISLEEYDTL